MMHIVAETSPVEVAWAAFDRSVIRLHVMYRRVGEGRDTPFDRAARMKVAQETARLWDEWRDLYLADTPGSAA